MVHELQVQIGVDGALVSDDQASGSVEVPDGDGFRVFFLADFQGAGYVLGRDGEDHPLLSF